MNKKALKTVMLRRRKLGLTSCREVSKFSKEGITFVRNDKPIPPGTEMVIRWGTTSNIPDHVRVLNSAKAIHGVANNMRFRMTLDEHELCPRTWFGCGDESFLEEVYQNPGPEGQKFPVIVRRANHAQGRYLHLCHNYREVQLACMRYGEGNYYISEVFPKVEEYRVFVVQGRAVAVAKKTPGNPNDIAWNVAKGGRFDNVRWNNWPLKAIKVSIEAFNLSELDFGGVDVMVDRDGNVSVLEINSAPSLTSPYRQQCMAKAFDYIIRNESKERIPLVQEKGGYRKFIHPAIFEGALV